VSQCHALITGVPPSSEKEVHYMEDRLQGISSLPILVIDDVKSARALLGDMLQQLGFSQCLEASDGAEALEILKKTRVQLILCDFRMDGMNGMQLLSHLNKRHPEEHAPVIFVSAVGDVSSVDEAISRGATGYLVKPISFRKLKRRIEQTLIHHSG
jgi:CheY-like chemotaxis protein